jgi:hypothetical protein
LGVAQRVLSAGGFGVRIADALLVVGGNNRVVRARLSVAYIIANIAAHALSIFAVQCK